MNHITEAFTSLVSCQPDTYRFAVNEEGYTTFVKNASTVIAYNPGSHWKITNHKALVNLCDEYELRSFSSCLPLGEAMILEIAKKVNTCTLLISDLSNDFDECEPDPSDFENNWKTRTVYDGDWVEVLFESQSTPMIGRVLVECRGYKETLVFREFYHKYRFNLEKEITVKWRKLFPKEIKELSQI